MRRHTVGNVETLAARRRQLDELAERVSEHLLALVGRGMTLEQIRIIHDKHNYSSVEWYEDRMAGKLSEALLADMCPAKVRDTVSYLTPLLEISYVDVASLPWLEPGFKPGRDAACTGSGLGIDFFFSRETVKEAKALCAGCPVRWECLARAFQTESFEPTEIVYDRSGRPRPQEGIWGGLSPSKRLELLETVPASVPDELAAAA